MPLHAARPSLLPVYPFSNIKGAVQKLDALRFTDNQEAHYAAVHELHFVEIQDGLPAATIDQSL